MPNWNNCLRLLLGLVAVVKPIGAIPTFISLTTNRLPEEMLYTAIVCAFSVAMGLLLTLIAAEFIVKGLGGLFPVLVKTFP